MIKLALCLLKESHQLLWKHNIFSGSFNVTSIHNFQKVAILKTEHFLSRNDSNFIKKIETDGKYLRMLFFPGIKGKYKILLLLWKVKAITGDNVELHYVSRRI